MINENNVFTYAERRLLALFYLGDVLETYNILRFALSDMTDLDDRAAAKGLISKLLNVDESTIANILLESEESYV